MNVDESSPERGDPLEREIAALQAAVASSQNRLDASISLFLGALEEGLQGALATADQVLGRTLQADDVEPVQGSSDNPLGALGLTSEYRDQMTRNVIQPLAHILERGGNGNRVLDAWEEFRRSLTQIGKALPHSVSRPEPANLYTPGAKDHTLRRLGMALARSRRHVGAAARTVGRVFTRRPPPLQEQTVPLRALGRYHLTARVPRATARGLEALIESVAVPIARIERASDYWIHGIFDLEASVAIGLSTSTEAVGEGEPPVPTREALDAQHQRLISHLEKALEEVRDLQARVNKVDLDPAHQAFIVEAGRSGTFMVNATHRSEAALARINVHLDRRWETFFERAANRLSLILILSELRKSLLELVRSLRSELEATAEKDCDALAETAKALKELAEGLTSTDLDADLISSHQEKALQLVNSLGQTLRSLRGADEAARASARTAEGVLHLIRSLPTTLPAQELQDPDGFVASSPPLREYRLAEVGSQAFDALAIEQIRTCGAAGQAYGALEGGLLDVKRVLTFNLGSAQEEMSGDSTDLADARELIVGGLERSAVQLDTLASGLRATVTKDTDQMLQALGRPWNRFRARVRVEDQRKDELIGIWHEVVDWSRDSYSAYRTWLESADDRLRTLASASGRRFLKLVRLGQEVVLQDQASEAETERTLRALQEADELRESFPVVYERLFSGLPVKDPNLMVGRASSLSRVRHIRRRWERGVAPLLTVVAEAGAGKTTFLNLLEAEVFSDVACLRVSLAHRYTCAEEFLETIRQAIPETHAPPPFSPELSVADQTTALFDALVSLAGNSRVAVMIDDVEHLIERRVGGAAIMRDLLTQLRRSPPTVWWIMSAAPHGWSLLETLEPTAATLVPRLDLPLLTRDELETVILDRHRRSGLPLEFREPEDQTRRFRRELRRAGTTEARQALIQQTFFDQMHRATNGDLSLALFSWLRLLDLDRDHRLLYVRPFRSLSFSFLAQLSLEQAFALKSLLDHRSLTPREHSRIRNQDPGESLLIFESLLGLWLIDPAVGMDETGTPAMEDHRYLIHPLANRAVREHLRGRHIVH